MDNQLREYAEKFDKQPIRMRLLLTFVGLMVVVLIVDSLWISDNYKQAKKLQSDIHQIEDKIKLLNNSQNEINLTIANQRNNPLLIQLSQTNERIENLKSQLEEKTINLVKPELMANVLREIIQKSNGLELVSLSKQPTESLFETNESVEQIQVFRHPFELVLKGGYQETMIFIQQLENMPQKVNFESFEFSVDNYPASKVTLLLSTLSLNQEWIGG